MLSQLSVADSDISDAGIDTVIGQCARLREFDLSYCVHIGTAGVIKLAVLCSTLTALKLSGCVEITDSALVALSQPDILRPIAGKL